MSNTKPLWIPSEKRIADSNFRRYEKFLKLEYDLQFADYSSLHKWSTTEIKTFWESIWKFSGILHSKNYDKVIDKRIMPGAEWFEGAKLNFAENLLRYNDNHPAIISSREEKPDVVLTYSELNGLVTACSSSLKKLGVKTGDRIAGFVTNIPESIIAMLSAVSLGAVWTSCSPDFGTQGVLDRFGQVKPKILLAYHFACGLLIDKPIADCKKY